MSLKLVCGVLQVKLQLLGPFMYHIFTQMYYAHFDTTFKTPIQLQENLMVFFQQGSASNSVCSSESIFGTIITNRGLWPPHLPDQNI